MKIFYFKPANLRRKRSFSVSDIGIICRGGEGEFEWSVPWQDICEATFAEHRTRGKRIWRLDLATSDALYRIAIDQLDSEEVASEDQLVYFDMMDAVCHALDQAKPGFQAALAAHRDGPWAYLVIGTLSLTLGVGLLLLSWKSGVLAGWSRASISCVGLIVLGGVLIGANHPRKGQPNVLIRLFPPIIRTWTAPR